MTSLTVSVTVRAGQVWQPENLEVPKRIILAVEHPEGSEAAIRYKRGQRSARTSVREFIAWALTYRALHQDGGPELSTP